jgi:hypothetical protein
MAWGTGTTVEDTEVYKGPPDDTGITVEGINQGQIDLPPLPETYRHHTPAVKGGLGPVPSASTNINFYLDDDYDLPVEEGILPDVVDQTGETQRNQALFDLFTLGQLSGQTPWGQFQVNAPQQSFGFLFNEQPAPFLGQNARVSPFIGINPRGGMIGVRGDF